MKKSAAIDQSRIVELYGDHLLENGERPKNVYSFAKQNRFEESLFYQFFSGFEQLEMQMLEQLFQKSVSLASGIDQYAQMPAKEQLLNVYFIFFENLTLNRSLVLTLLEKENLLHAKHLQGLKKEHRNFVQTLDLKETELFEKTPQKVKDFTHRSKEELLWLHLVSCIEFWKKDTSASFEKTDLYIEKTIDTGFELIENEPLKKILDLGKFLWKEKFNIG